MKVLLINVNCGLQSTGRICTDLAGELISSGNDAEVAYGRDNVPTEFRSISYKIGNDLDVYVHALYARLFDAVGLGSKYSTIRLIKHIEKYNPDIIHLHNLHGYYINIQMLFDYLKSRNTPVIWTLHDCWAFTGHCAHYTMAKCDKWKTICHNCSQFRSYPSSLFLDKSSRNFMLKKNLFDLDNLYIVTVSHWLQSQAENSFFHGKNIRTIYNGIDLSLYKKKSSSLRLGDDKRTKILGVSSIWNEEKGLFDYLKLAHCLDDSFIIFLVGKVPSNVKLPENIVCLGTINGKKEIIDIYSSCDILVNFSYQETFSLVTLEAMACELPVMVYNTTALPEVVSENGKIIDVGDVSAAVEYLNEKNYTVPNLNFLNKFSADLTLKNYMSLYLQVFNEMK